MKRSFGMTARALGLAIALPGAGHAQGMPVYDATAVTQLLEQVANQVEQLTALQAQLESMTGVKGISGILNSTADQAARGAATDLTSLIDGAISGAPIAGANGALTARLDELRSTFNLAELPDFLASDIPQDRAIATLGGSGLAVMATADDTYLRANASMTRANTLIGQIDANPDLKASVDYNTRMLGEILTVLNESLRLQAAMANALGSQTLASARDGVAARQFMKVGDK